GRTRLEGRASTTLGESAARVEHHARRARGRRLARDHRPGARRIASARGPAARARLVRRQPYHRPLSLMSFTVGVSFAKTPLAEGSENAAALEALGWHETDRGDPWATSFSKDVPEQETDPAAEVRGVMGEYWLSADEIRELLDRD